MVTTLLVAAELLIAFMVLRSFPRGEQIAFNDRFSPISDEEFLGRQRARINAVIALKVRKIVADSSGIDYERIYPSSRFVEDLG